MTPGFVEGEAVGLQRVVDADMVVVVLLLVGNGFLEKFQAAQGRFSALVGVADHVFGTQHGLADDVFEGLLGHEAVGGLLPLLGFVAVEAVGAGHVAHAGCGFHKHTDSRHRDTSLSVVLIKYNIE